ncbi:MAG: PQQ-binding-like beta-propeller repeat protein [Leptolinea sp.]
MQKSKISIVFFITIIAALLAGCSGAGAVPAGWPGSLVVNKIIYTASGSHVFAVNAETGAEIWRFPVKPEGTIIFGSAPILEGGQLIAGDYEFRLHSLNPDTGGEIWVNKDAAGRWIGSPIAIDGLILAPNADHNLYAINSNGIVQWKFTAKNGLWNQPVTDGKNVFVSSMDKNLYALNPKTGKVIWSIELGGAVMFSQTMGEDGILYIATINNEILAISPDTGRINWKAKTDGTVWEPVVIKDGTLYAGDQSGKVFALSAKDGHKIWDLDAGAPVIGGTALTDKGLFFGTGHINSSDAGEAMLVTTNGKKVWSQPVGGKLYSRPVVSGNLVVFGVFEGDKTLAALDENGKIVWSFNPSK